MTLNRRSFLATSAAASATLSMPAILKAQPREFVLGASLPMTGPQRPLGQAVVPAFKIAQTLFNEEGGITGTPIRFALEDSRSIPQITRANFLNALANEGRALLGFFADSTSAMKLITPELTGERARIMGSLSFSSALADPQNAPYQFVAGPTYDDQIETLLKQIKSRGGTQIAILYAQTECGRDPLAFSRASAAQHGLQIALEAACLPRGGNLAAQISQLKKAGVEHCILHGFAADGLRQLADAQGEIDPSMQFYSTFSGMQPSGAVHAIAQAATFQGTMPYRHFEDAPRNSRFQRYAAHTADLPISALQALCSLELMIEAMRRTANAGLELRADTIAQTLAGITNWDSSGFFDQPVSVKNNRIATGRIYAFSAEQNRFVPSTDWIST
ncbi:ABC transporter substrate-binding protein [Planktotalea sp.]|uniref:ABC transporter substrate-binding protein n=1 Tax=Planktotalea sp. TaxID=2029877 RepID=UPI003D6C57C3